MVRANVNQTYKNVEVSSRYDCLGEVDTMKEIIDGLSLISRLQIHSIFCDSKASACYSIEACSGADLESLKWELYHWTKMHEFGHNGIAILSKEGDRHIDPEWPGDDEYF